jgi:hypothetical protein
MVIISAPPACAAIPFRGTKTISSSGERSPIPVRGRCPNFIALVLQKEYCQAFHPPSRSAGQTRHIADSESPSRSEQSGSFPVRRSGTTALAKLIEESDTSLLIPQFQLVPRMAGVFLRWDSSQRTGRLDCRDSGTFMASEENRRSYAGTEGIHWATWGERLDDCRIAFGRGCSPAVVRMRVNPIGEWPGASASCMTG